MSGKADEELLASLHGALTKDLIKRIKDGTATASDLSVARQLLKDNGINADGKEDPEMQNLSDELPDDLDNVTPMYGR